MEKITDLARGRWPEILANVGLIDDSFLTGKHGPCPFCQGEDRWRWDNKDDNGTGFCAKCGGRGSAGGSISGMDLLMRSRGWSFAEAAKELERFLGNDTQLPIKTVKSTKRPARTPEIPPAGTPPPALGRATAQWCYGSLEGEPWYFVQRIEDSAKLDKRGKPSKTIVRRFWLDGKWHFPSRKDPFSIEWSAPRPLLGWEQLATRAGDPVLVVEGEPTWDAAAMLFPGYVVLTWPNGGKSVQLSDWAPLAGREVVIWPDADPDGAACAKKLSGILREVGAGSVSVVKPPEGAALGWDLADAGEWTEDDALAYLKGNCEGVVEEVEDSGVGGEAAERVDGDSRPYTLLGFSGDDYFYQPGDSGQVTRISGPSHAPTNLYRVAPIDYWKEQYPRFNGDGEFIGINWQQCYSDLFREQHMVGCYDPSRIRGVGAWWDDGRTVFHLGDRLIVDGATHPVLKPPESHFIYQRLPRRDGPGAAKPLTDQEGANLLSVAERFHWESSTSGTLLAGWTALAPICGALEWRPHIWLNAVSGSGKSSLMDLFVAPLLSDMGFFVLGNTTEAGIRQKLKSDALPVVFDEAESNEKRDIDRMQGVLSLARAASSEGRGVTVKGSVASEAMMFNVRSMFMLSSINMALKQGADRSRFSVLMLRIPDDMTTEAKAEHWKALKTDLVAAVTPDTGRSLVARMVNLIPEVRESAKVFSAAAAVELDGARVGDQIGTLLAGAWMLQNQRPPTEEQARGMIRLFDWEQHGRGGDERGGDQGSCLSVILQARIRLDLERGSVSFTVAELIERAGPGGGHLQREAVAELGRHGILVENDCVLISNTAEGIKRLLRDTQWSGGGWANLLRSLAGAERTDKPVWFPELKTMNRATKVPKALMRQA